MSKHFGPLTLKLPAFDQYKVIKRQDLFFCRRMSLVDYYLSINPLFGLLSLSATKLSK